jgi:hypothetical protein
MRRMMSLIGLSLAACGHDYWVEQSFEYRATAPPSQHDGDEHEVAQLVAPLHPLGYGSSVMVLQSRHLDRATEVVGIIDVHLPVGNQDAALAELRARAAEMGADAVVGAEFHHGEGAGEPIHVSGMAVRFIQLSPAL